MFIREVLKIHKITREIEATYPSAAKAAASEDMRHNRMKEICRNKTLPPGMFYYRYSDEFDPNESFDGKRNCPVLLIDTINKLNLWFGDMVHCANQVGWDRHHIYTYIGKNNKLLGGQYHPVYITNKIFITS